VAIPPRLEGPAQVSIPEEIEWTWEVRPAGSDPGLPNVVLLGDSIIATIVLQLQLQLQSHDA
jgi:hypothetical protein